MILVLATRFRKYIALFLYCIFYSQLIMAAESLRGSAGNVSVEKPSQPWFRNSRSFLPAVHAAVEGHNLATVIHPDSMVKPDWHPAPVKKVSEAILSRPAHPAKAFIGGPSQPEMNSFQSVNSNNMVDLFTGDFAYNIPLLDVGGYPVNIAYHSGRSMDEDASWVGLGWNINPGSITRDMRGLPDDFSGGSDTIKKVASIKPNVTMGASLSATVELVGLPLDVGVSGGIFHSTYAGWGLETGLNASLNAGSKSNGSLTGGLSLTNNSQNGITINPSLSYQYALNKASDNAGPAFGAGISTSYNSRTGLKDIHLGFSVLSEKKMKEVKHEGHDVQTTGSEAAGISFAWPTYTPTISVPMTNYNYSVTLKLGGQATVAHPNLFVSAYFGREYIAASDISSSIPAYGYLNFQNRGSNWAAITDFNREKELPYREKPAVPHIAVPAYTYDVFNISGEGTGGMFRAYRGDIGFVADHLLSNKSQSGAVSADVGAGDIVHGGTDLNANYSTTKSGPWLTENPLSNTIKFQNSQGLFEAAYFRNPSEKAINTTDFYNAIGGDNVVVAGLSQSGSSITTNPYLTLMSGQKQVGIDTLTPAKAIRNTRDKRAQVISYLTASEASVVGLDKYINHYTINQFGHYCENDAPAEPFGKAMGLQASYFTNLELSGTPKYTRLDTFAFFNWGKGSPFWHNDDGILVTTDQSFPTNNYSVRWKGRLQAPVSGTYAFGLRSGGAARLWIDDSLVINDWQPHHDNWDTVRLNLVAGGLYNLRLEYSKYSGYGYCQLGWRRPDYPNHPFGPDHKDTIKTPYLYPPVLTDTVGVNPILTREDRVNNFRKPNHLSEIDVLNPDGRRYVYGIPVYNLLQKEVSFSVNASEGNTQTGLTSYDSTENSTHNSSGKNGYYNREEIPAYAHSFLLTGILSPDYVDVTGDGISDDDIGDAVRFDYSKTSGIANPYGWRAPYVNGKANYNEGLRSYNRDDKANYIAGSKELWYLHTIESKTMIATFTLQPRSDLLEIDENGVKTNTGKAQCLKEINLYSKADFMQHGTAATPIKTVHFEYSYELCRGINELVNDSGKLTLKKIWFTYNGNNKGVLNPYVFNYHANNPGYQVNMSDKWGIYKDPLQNPGSTTSNILTNAEYPYALQDSALAASNAGAWNLDSIQLPSGGRLKVNYESDDYAYVQNRRATQMFKVAGVGTDITGYGNKLYHFLSGSDGLYVYITVPNTVTAGRDIYTRYLEGLGKIYFRLFVTMPKDDFGSGAEYIPCFAVPDTTLPQWYGKYDANTIWVKIKGVNKTGDADGLFSPLAQTAINFLRINLPSKAYPGSEISDDITPMDGIKIVTSQLTNVIGFLNGFTNTARGYGWASTIDPNRSFARLDCPVLKKYGGGLRVKSILIYDNWKAMANKKETVYGQAYDYTTTRSINGVKTNISSGVASWEPAVGSEENPFHLPIEYVERVSVLAPAALQYTEEPLGETFYPGPSVGYSSVKVRSIPRDKARSANGYTQTTFFTTYDFPTSWDWSALDNNTKKRYKPLLNNLLRINSKSYLTLSQGFKVELNDMNGKLRSEASYPETDTLGPISYTENFYKVDNASAQFKHLSNTVTTIDPQGNIDTSATIGKDAELMTDMRDQTSNSIGGNVNINVDIFAAGVWPVVIPSLLNLYQHETTQFRSVAMTKVIQRYGILDSVVHIDKGSRVSSKNLLYDAETGEPLLVMTLNEFNDSIYQFTYPSHWVYTGTGPAYQNIDALLSHLSVVHGKLKQGPFRPDSVYLPFPDSNYLAAGDELLVYSKQNISIKDCFPTHNLNATFSDSYKLWVVDTNTVHGGTPALFLVDKNGTPFSGSDMTLKVVRSGHRNLGGAVGSVASLANPLVLDGQNKYHLQFDTTTRIVSAGASELQQLWKVADKRRSDVLTSCIYTPADSALAAQEGCSCLKPFFSYLISSHNLFIPKTRHITVRTLVTAANAHGAGISLDDCPILKNNADSYFYSLSVNPNSAMYMAVLGSDVIDLRSISGLPMPIYSMVGGTCDSLGRVIYKNPGAVVTPPDTVTVNIIPSFSVNLLSSIGSACPSNADSLLQVDSVSDRLLVENSLSIDGTDRNAVSILRFGRFDRMIPGNSNILSAKLILQADQRGHYPPQWPNANSVNLSDSIGFSLSAPAGWFPYQPLDTMLYQAYYTPWFAGSGNTVPFQSDTLDVAGYLSGYLSGVYPSSTFVLTQGSGGLHATGGFDSAMVANNEVPPYLSGGYSNYYATYYSQRYADSTKWPMIQVRYITPQPLTDTAGAVLEFNSTISCNTVYGRSCYSAITDTLINPYQYAVLGNYRPQRSYVYYGRRNESDPADTGVSIRTAGVIKNFAPFWTLQSGHWKPSYDTSRWVWNSQTTLFNRKGFELENKDPLGRYNAGLYGYGLTLPTAVIQNSRYQESAFEGFEDYGYIASSCDSSCAEARPFDFSAYLSNISDSMAHTGLYSLRVQRDSSISLIGLKVAAAADSSSPQLTDTLSADNCTTTRFDGLKASSNTVLPSFTPIAGKKMLVSAWVKEEDICTCKTYSRNHILVNFTLGTGGSTAISLTPSGNMIEGWQRFETVVYIPSNAVNMSLTLQASDSSTTYFDDIRLLPFNAEMKSYVYNPINLRLMAELDENNYATFYEYDDDGTLIRVKKETERGIQTIKETRSALLKDQ